VQEYKHRSLIKGQGACTEGLGMRLDDAWSRAQTLS